MDDASFSYTTTTYCPTDIDPTPSITGLAGGSFTSTPAGLTLTAADGTIDVSTSTAGLYTITYTTAGTCQNTSTVTVTVSSCTTCDIDAFFIDGGSREFSKEKVSPMWWNFS